MQAKDAILIILAIVVGAGGVAAFSQKPDTRFMMVEGPSSMGVWRLNTASGAIDFCTTYQGTRCIAVDPGPR